VHAACAAPGAAPRASARPRAPRPSNGGPAHPGAASAEARAPARARTLQAPTEKVVDNPVEPMQTAEKRTETYASLEEDLCKVEVVVECGDLR